jgi:hypothetical protein
MALGVLFPIGNSETTIQSTALQFLKSKPTRKRNTECRGTLGAKRGQTCFGSRKQPGKKGKKERKHNDACTLCALSGWLAQVDDAGYEMEAFWALLLVHRKIREGQTKQLYLYSCTTRTEEIETSPGRWCVRLKRWRMG